MTNPLLGDTRITLRDGEHTLRFSTGAMIAMEELVGQPFGAIYLEFLNQRVSALRNLLWAGLLEEHNAAQRTALTASPAQVKAFRALLDAGQLDELLTALERLAAGQRRELSLAEVTEKIDLRELAYLVKTVDLAVARALGTEDEADAAPGKNADGGDGDASA